MAAAMNARRDKPSTIFTLPISCQICLGKVKQPVLCPNNHAFCSPCMDIWLQKIQQCPACRTPINPNNPIKQIKGGLNPAEDDVDKMSNPNLRKTRFELLYREYEDEFDRLEAELKLLKTENDILKSEAASTRGQSGVVSEKCNFVHPSMSDTSGLLALTKKLQGAQKLYEHLKSDMSKVKQENNKLKDENVNLNRENEKLRIEIASRSPHRYGRYTVATLESKIESYEKEIRQLNKALERSDKYVDDLEGELNRLKGTNMGTSGSVPPKSLCLKRESIGQVSVNGSITENSTAKRQLFGSSMDDLRSLSAENGMKSKPRQHTELLGSDKIQRPSVNGETEIKSKQLNTEKIDLLDLDKGKVSLSPAKDQSPTKKVHFSLPKDTSSFDLDKPSPLNQSSSLKHGRSSPSDIESRYFNDSDLPSRRSESLVNGNMSLYSLEGNEVKGKSSLKPSDPFEDSSNMSHLSLPGPNKTPTKKVKHGNDLDISELDDTQTIRSELDDLNISLTPELSDCLKLLNRAEKKSHVYGGVGINVAGNMGTHNRHSTANAVSSSHPYHSTTNAVSSSHPYHSTTNAVSSPHPYHPQTDTVKKTWEDEYYSKVKSNPYKSQSGGVHFLDSVTSRSDVHSTTGLGQSDYHTSYPNSSLSSSYPLPTSEAVPVSASVESSQSKGTSVVQDIDDKLFALGISGSKHRKSNLSNLGSHAAFPSRSGSVLTSNPESSSYGPEVTDISFYSSLPITSAVQSSQKLLFSSDLSSQNLSHRRSSLDYGKNLYLEPHKTSGTQNLLANQNSGRKYSSLTNLPVAASVSAVSALSNYSQTVGSHLNKLNQLFPTTTTGSLKTMSHFSGASQNHPSYSLLLTGGPPADVLTVPSSYAASSRERSSQLLPASCSLSASSLPASSYANTAYTSGSTSLSKLSSQDKIDYQGTVFDIEKKGNYSYVSNASNDLSSRGSDSFLPEPKKRLFESGDDLDLTLSPIKSTRIS